MGRIETKEFVMKDGRKGMIRCAEKRDAEPLLRLFNAIITQDAYNVTTPADVKKMGMTVEKEEQYIEEIQHHGGLILVLQVGRDIAGLVSLKRGDKQRTAHVGILGISVDRRYRQIGVATALLKASLEWARSDPQLEKVALGVLANHEVAVNLYKKLGFIEEGRKIKEFKLASDIYADDMMMYQWVK